MNASTKSGGLGGTNPFNRQAEREEAARDVVPRKNQKDNEQASDVASNVEDHDATDQGSDIAEGDPAPPVEPSETAALSAETPPPPPAKEPEARVQMNTRILADRDKRLRRYQRKYGVTRQAVVDQMVDEYLRRRGLLE